MAETQNSLGSLTQRQKKYDEAKDVYSRASRLRMRPALSDGSLPFDALGDLEA